MRDDEAVRSRRRFVIVFPPGTSLEEARRLTDRMAEEIRAMRPDAKIRAVHLVGPHTKIGKE